VCRRRYTVAAANASTPENADARLDAELQRDDITMVRPRTLIAAAVLAVSVSVSFDSVGGPGDVPVPADYDGDGITDVAVYRPSTGVWYVLTSTSGFRAAFARTWGLPGDIPIVGDFDKDGKNDLAVYRPATGVWFVPTSGSNYTSWIARQWAHQATSRSRATTTATASPT
jgi:hypothetical protein